MWNGRDVQLLLGALHPTFCVLHLHHGGLQLNEKGTFCKRSASQMPQTRKLTFHVWFLSEIFLMGMHFKIHKFKPQLIIFFLHTHGINLGEYCTFPWYNSIVIHSLFWGQLLEHTHGRGFSHGRWSTSGWRDIVNCGAAASFTNSAFPVKQVKAPNADLFLE